MNEIEMASVCDLELSEFEEIEQTDIGFRALVFCLSCRGTGDIEQEHDFCTEIITCHCCMGRGKYWLHFNETGKLI